MARCLPSIPHLPLCCPKCSFQTHSGVKLRQHAWQHHLGNSDSSCAFDIKKPTYFTCTIYLCSLCCSSTTEHSLLQQHVKFAHVDVTNSKKPLILRQQIQLSMDEMPPITDSPSECEVEPEVDANAYSPARSEPPLIQDQSRKSPVSNNHSVVSTGSSVRRSNMSLGGRVEASGRASSHHAANDPPVPVQDWSTLIARSEKKFICLVCRRYIYNGRTEVVFHAVTRHIIAKEIETDLSDHGRLSESVKHQIGRYFADGMRIRSGVHYKDAKRVEAALFRSIELHLRYRAINASKRLYTCSGCGATSTETQVAFAHVNDELRSSLPEFMRARSCPWSLSNREEWVWCVPDLPIQPLPETDAKSVADSVETEEGEEQAVEAVRKAAHIKDPELVASTPALWPLTPDASAMSAAVVSSFAAAAGLFSLPTNSVAPMLPSQQLNFRKPCFPSEGEMQPEDLVIRRSPPTTCAT